MLQTQTVDSALLELTKKIFQLPAFDNFVLVGGTALSLQIGNRISIDIDLFSQYEFAINEIEETLKNNFNIQIKNKFKNTILSIIENIKVDIISHQYEWVKTPKLIDGIRISSLEDIAAMKLDAIADNGTRLKDFIDVAFLSTYFTLEEMLHFFEKKYPSSNSMMAFKSLQYYEDINFDVDIIYVGKTLSWEIVKERLKNWLKIHSKNLVKFS